MAPGPESNPRFESLQNFRDVADSIQSDGQSPLRSGLFYRSARPDETTISDRKVLVEALQITTIVDLRTTTELINAGKLHELRTMPEESTAISLLPASPIDTLRIPGIEYAEINLNGRGFERSLIWHLSYYSLARVLGYLAFGYRMEAIGIIGQEVLRPRGLVGLAIDTLEHSQPEIKALFDLLSQEDRWPVMIHCTQGKDRTGLSIILVLLLCHVDLEAITRDYMKSEPDSNATLQARLKDTSSIGLDESFARCAPALPERVKQHVDENYGSIEGYLVHIGVSEIQLEQIRGILSQNLKASNDEIDTQA